VLKTEVMVRKFNYAAPNLTDRTVDTFGGFIKEEYYS
jgi:hypothetical protein